MGKKAFTEKNGVFHLIEDTDDNRDELNKRITEIIQKEGNKKSIKSITYGPNKKPYRVSTNSIKDLLAKKVDRVKITTKNVNRAESEIRPGANVRPGSKAFKRTDELTKAFIKRISGIEGHTPEKLERYFSELNKEIRELHIFVGKRNKELKAAGADESQLVSRGHYARLSKSVDSPRNLWLELMVPNKAKGNRYSPNQGAMTAIGNPIKETVSAVENWKNDYVTWLDRPENGGSGILPQRGDYSPLMEQKFNLITGEQWEKLSAKDKLKANNVINDLVRDQEKLNQFLPSQGAARRKWGLLLPDQANQASKLVTDGIQKTPDVTELGRPLGGLGTKLNMTGKYLRRAILANTAYSFVNPRSIRAATNIIAEGPNKENIKEVGLGVRDDLIHTGVIKALGMATGAKALSIGGTVGAVPLGVGLVGGMALNSIVEGATGKNLKEIGEQAEEKQLYREYHGLTNKKSDRQNYRHSTSPEVTQEMLEEWDTEIRQGWYEDSLEDRQLNSPLKETGKYLKAAQ